MLRLGFPAAAFLVVSLGGCGYNYVAPQPPPEREPISLTVPLDRAEGAVLGVLAKADMPLATSDRSSGLIVAQALVVTRPQSTEWSNCGHTKGYDTVRDRAFATRGAVSVQLRPAGQGSTVRVTVAWSKPDMEADRATCVTTGAFERSLEERIRAATASPP